MRASAPDYYLAGGGLFNPELAHHDAVRDLVIYLRADNERLTAALATARRDALMWQTLRKLSHHIVLEIIQSDWGKWEEKLNALAQKDSGNG